MARILFVPLLSVLLSLPVGASAAIEQVPFTQVHFHDTFWAPRMEVNRTVSIPSAFRQCELNGRFDNFALAGGLVDGEHRGDFPFDDTDPYKIIEGANYSLATHYDVALDHYLDSIIALIAAAQEPDGYLTTCVTNRCDRLRPWWGSGRWDRINSHELYNSGHLYEAAVAHYLATGKRTLLDVAIRNADLVCQVFGPDDGQIHRPSGHPIVEMALCKLYKVTGDERYLREALYFVQETGRCTDGHAPSPYSQDHEPILEQDEIVGHAVRAGYLYSGVADVAALTGDTAYQHALQRIWLSMAGSKLYLTGGIGSRAQGEGFGPAYELPNHTSYCETCAAIANVYWNYRMFLATGHGRYVDLCERALYNGVISGVSLSGDRFFYDNPLASMGQHERAPWFGCACCPGNITRFMASVPYYMYATQDDDLYVNLYVASTAEVHTAHQSLRLTMETDYPWDGRVTLTVNACPKEANPKEAYPKEAYPKSLPKEGTCETAGTESPSPREGFRMGSREGLGVGQLRLRIPGWTGRYPVGTDLYEALGRCRPVALRVNGRRVSYDVVDGYAVVSRCWHDGDVVTLDLPMRPRRIRAHDAVDYDRGLLAVQRGPIVYCMEGQDQPGGTVFDKHLPAHARIRVDAFRADTLGGIVPLTARRLTLIPYAVWNNRGRDQMAVWMPTRGAHPKSLLQGGTCDDELPSSREGQGMGSTCMLRSADGSPVEALPLDSVRQEWAYGVDDGWEPRHSGDVGSPYHYWWLRYGTDENLCYLFDEPRTVSATSVYWLNLDHYDGNFRVPAGWQLYYLDDDRRWQPVQDATPFDVDADRWCRVAFRPVRTSGLLMVAHLQPHQSGGVLEWRVF